MTHTDALSLGVMEVREQIARVKRSLAAIAAEDAALYERVEARLAELVVESEGKLAAAERELGTADANGTASRELRQAREAARLLFRESFAFIEGALSRREGLDGGLCKLADKLLDSVSSKAELNWRGLTILAETSFYGEAADVIRLKYPELSIWHLPIAAHEFGHFANPAIKRKTRQGPVWSSDYPVKTILDREAKRDSKHWFHAHEFFADVFAVYALGPAYAYSTLLLRPDTGARSSESPYHPSWDDRYSVIVATLGRIVGHGGASQAIVDDVARRWAAVRSPEPAQATPDTKRIRRLVDKFYAILDENLAGVRHSTFGTAQQIVPLLVVDEPLPPLEGVTMPDVLNAAWLARIGDLDNARRTAVIEQKALSACGVVA